jgi:acetaldehyde dehydrogenase
MLMRDTVFTLTDDASPDAQARISASILATVSAVQAYVPGYRLKQEIQFDAIPADQPINVPGIGLKSGLKTTVFIEVEGAAHYLPSYAGNLDIMTSAALATGEHIARHRLETAFGATVGAIVSASVDASVDAATGVAA